MRPPRRYEMMRPLALVLLLIAAACGSSTDPQIAAGEGTTSEPTVTSSTDSTAVTSPPEPTVPGTTEPGTRPVTTKVPRQPTDQPLPGEAPTQAPAPGILSIEDSLLPDDAFPAPWEPQWRNVDQPGYGTGPNQTDCDGFAAYDRLLGAGGGHAFWWVDGGNANHQVLRVSDEGEMLTSLVTIGGLADECPVVRWFEGGSFKIEGFAFDDGFGFRFVDSASGDVTWVAVTARDDLISMLNIPLWTRADGTMIDFTVDDLESLVVEMHDRLEQAGPAPDGPGDTPVIVAPTVPTTAPPPPPAPELPGSGVGSLLLGSGDLPEPWQLTDVDQYSASGPDDELVAACPAAASIDRVDAALAWEAEWRHPSLGEVGQFVGQVVSAAEATAIVEQFAEMVDCDAELLVPDSTSSGGMVALESGHPAATLFVHTPDEGHIGLLVGAFDSIVVVVTIEGSIADVEEAVVDIADAALAKIGAATG